MAINFFCARDALAHREPFDLRGIRLGVTLEEFRSALHPDRPKDIIEVLCSGDTVATGYDFPPEIEISSDERQAGIVRCGFFNRSIASYMQWDVRLGNRFGYPVFEFFKKADLEPYRLSMIVVAVSSKFFDEIAGAYREKYGAPTAQSTVSVQNRTGATFPTQLWAGETPSVRSCSSNEATDSIQDRSPISILNSAPPRPSD